jgi:methionyl-tRNA formyltransferase
VKEAALDEGYPVLTPERPRGDAFLAELDDLEPELSVVVAYGHLLPGPVLKRPSRGSINVHASLLPLLRGAAPVTWAIARGHEASGVTIMRMVEEMDAGPLYTSDKTAAFQRAMETERLGYGPFHQVEGKPSYDARDATLSRGFNPVKDIQARDTTGLLKAFE